MRTLVVELGYEYKVIGRIALTDDGALRLSGDTKTLEWWIARLRGKRTAEEFVRTLPRRLNSLLWARFVGDRGATGAAGLSREEMERRSGRVLDPTRCGLPFCGRFIDGVSFVVFSWVNGTETEVGYCTTDHKDIAVTELRRRWPEKEGKDSP